METTKTLGNFVKDLPRPAVMCTIVKVTGSAPQRAGARMWVTRGKFYGTLGGGEFERRVLARAREFMSDGRTEARLEEHVLCKEMGQCCGGRVEVFFEPVPGRKAVHLLGGGHVGRATASVLSKMPFDIHLIDSRPEWGSREGLPDDIQVHREDPAEYVAKRRWGPEDAVCVFTHSHDLDLALVRNLLRRPVGYLGLIGSEHKAAVFLSRLKAGSADAAEAAQWEELWERAMHCPIGIPLNSKDPKIIAVSIAAELLQEWGLAKRAAPRSDATPEGSRHDGPAGLDDAPRTEAASRGIKT